MAKRFIVTLGLLLGYLSAQAFGVGIYYYVRNTQPTPVVIKVDGGKKQIVVPANQKDYIKVGKTKHTAYIFKIQHYITTQNIHDVDGNLLCQTQVNLGTFWDGAPYMENFSVSYIATPTPNCQMNYNRNWLNISGDTGRVYYDIN